MEPEFVDHLLYREQPAHQGVAFEAHAELLQVSHLGVDDLVGQPEIRDAIAQHPAGAMESLVDGDLATGLRHVGSTGHASRPGSDDADTESVGLHIGHVGPARVDGHVADEAFQPADGDGLERIAESLAER